MNFFSEQDDQTQTLSCLWLTSTDSSTKESLQSNQLQFFEEFYIQNQEKQDYLNLVLQDDIIWYKDGDSVKYFPLLLTSIQDRYFLKKGKKVFMLKLTNIKKKIKTKIFTRNHQAYIKLFINLSKKCILRSLNENYKIQSKIASTTFGEVHNAIDLGNQKEVIVKIYNKQKVKSQHAQNLLENQIQFLYSLKKQFISPLIEVYENFQSVILILQKARGGTLLQYIHQNRDQYNLSFIKQILIKILYSLKIIHSMGIIHRDLKPSNILFVKQTNCQLFINDFGISINSSAFIDKNFVFFNSGTQGFIAPEVMEYSPKKGMASYCEKSDMFSFGCIMYFLFKGRVLLDELTGEQTGEMLKNEIESKVNKLNLEQSGKDLLLNMLNLQPKERLGASAAINHEFFGDKLKRQVYRFNNTDEMRGRREILTDKIHKQWQKCLK